MKRIILSIAFVAMASSVFAWGQNGHRIVAEVCMMNLNDKAKNEIKAILGPDYLTEIATWPDYIRSEKKWDFAKEWHFITIQPNTTAAAVIKEGNENDTIENVAEAIELMKSILKGEQKAIDHFQGLMDKNGVKPLNGSVKATALAFLVHFIGDIHQPMHVGKNKDRGGNSVKVLFFDDHTSLHSAWDSGIIEQEGLSFTEFSKFVNKLEADEIKKLQKSTVTNWAEESVEAREEIYNTLYDNTDRTTGLPSFSYQYQHDFLPVVQKRLEEAGVRAAGIINAILG